MFNIKLEEFCYRFSAGQHLAGEGNIEDQDE